MVMARTFRDDPDLLADVHALVSDPLERTAVALWLMKHHTPETVGSLFAQQSPELLSAWTGPGVRESDREMFRRRARTVLEVHGG